MPEFGIGGEVFENLTDEVENEIDDALTLTRNHRTLEARVARLENQMTDINKAESDLAAVVQQTVSNEQGLAAQVASLQAAIASGNQQAVQDAANAIEQQVGILQGVLPAPAPAPAPAPNPPPAGP